ncbi:trimethyltridecatetraene synthase-like [Andrographis paniculata]|uniref:trimethyltridecatetraene synthase-like n=1 Tax=Andrographis paniculata TaxID=175694 RepID=UPI0021E90761|nr:trimethyltridecatetraene synthase-like [Andrographis paniculata]
MDGFLPLLLAFIAYMAALAFFFLKKNPKHNLPPGPKPWPLIGNLNLLGSLPHKSLDFLSKKYGEIMLLRFGQLPVVVASTPEMAEQFLRIHDTVFASRPAVIAGRYISYNYSDMVWAPYGPHWRQARKIYLSEVFSAKKMESELFRRILAEERRDFFSRMHSLSGKPVLLRDHLFRYALSTINRMLLSERYFSESGLGEEAGSVVRLEEYQEMMDEWFFLNGAFNIGDWIPFLSFLDLQGYVKRMKLLHKKLDRVYNFVVDDHLKRKVSGDGNDFVDTLLQMVENSDSDSDGKRLSKNTIKALIQNIIAGGADTTPTTVEWIILELMRHPNIYKKAKDELDRVIGGNRWVEEHDFSELHYLDAIIKETMRLHPISTILAPHYAMEDCRVAGYDIPKGTTVFINTWSIGRNPKYWETPEEFIPERFIGKQIDISGSNFALLPFGSGRRRCPGYKLALKTVRAIVANLLQGFDLKLKDGMKPEDISMEEKFSLSTHPKEALAIVMEPVLPLHLY